MSRALKSYLLLGLLLVLPAASAQQPLPAELMPLAHKSLLLDLARAGERLVAVGERGHILLSDDGGRAWRQVPAPVRAMLTGVYFVDARHGWVVGHDAVVLATADGGETWTLQYSDPEYQTPLFDVWFRDASHGIAVGAFGLVLVTQDAGATWEQTRLLEEDDFHLNQILAAPDGRIWVAGEAGHLYASDDNGASWQSLDTPYEGSFFGLLPLSAEHLLLYGLRGHLFESTDRGESWTQLDTDLVALLHGATRLPGGGAAVVGMDGALLLRPADSDRFRLHAQPDRLGLTAVLQQGDALVLSGEGGVRRLTLDALEH